MERYDSIINRLDVLKKHTTKGGEYWMGRDIQQILGYTTWENFQNVIKRAYMACESAGIDPVDHFLDTTKMITAGKGATRQKGDFFLTRYACYLIAMNGDASKSEIGIAQTYFAVQTRRQEIFDKLTDQEKRIVLRLRVKKANISLCSTAKRAGVQKYALFHDAGYKGLYEMGLTDIKTKKGIPLSDDLLDRAGRTELAANEFRITQTEEKLVRENVGNEKQAINTHYDVGKEIRETIKKLGGTMPEDLPPEESIKKITRKLQRQIEAGRN